MKKRNLKVMLRKKGKIFLSTPFSKEAAFNLNKLGFAHLRLDLENVIIYL